jgi:hypothetical protein
VDDFRRALTPFRRREHLPRREAPSGRPAGRRHLGPHSVWSVPSRQVWLREDAWLSGTATPAPARMPSHPLLEWLGPWG